MDSKWIFPIRYKILIVLSVIVAAAVAFYLYLASKIFYEDKTLLIYELNQTNVRTLATELESHLSKVFDKMRMFAILGEESTKSKKDSNTLEFFSINEEEFLRISLFKITRSGSEIIFDRVWPKVLSLYGMERSDLEKMRERSPIPFQKILSSGAWIRNQTEYNPENPRPFATIAIPVRIDGYAPRLLVAEVRLDRLINGFGRSGISEVYASDSEGFVLVHSNPERAQFGVSLAKDPLFMHSEKSKMKTEVKQFQDGERKFLGAYAHVDMGRLTVASKVELDEAWAAARVLIRKSFLYALIILTVAFLVALFFSHTLTEPIQKMVEFTKRIAVGDFSSRVRIASRDELAVLGVSFNSMTSQLKTAQQNLVQSERLAAVGQVARGVGHEFGNLLQRIVGKADIASHSNDPAKVKQGLEVILKAAEHASVIVRNLQSFSKTTAVKGEMKIQQTLDGALSLINHDLSRRSITVVDRREETPPILGNNVELGQVFMNLLINAMDAMPEQGGTIEVGCKSDGDFVVAWVKDTGSGIPPEVMPRIFEYAYTTKGDKGSGLGLSISKQLIEQHEGTISVESAPGQGAKFTIRIPKLKSPKEGSKDGKHVA